MGESNTPSVPQLALPAPVTFPFYLVQSTTGGTHIRRERDHETIFMRKTLCGVSTLGWAHLIDILPGEDVRGAIDCGRCRKAWAKL